MNREVKIQKLQKWALEEIEIFQSIQDVLLIESQITDDIGCLFLDNEANEVCHCQDCISEIMIFKLNGYEPGEKFLSAVYSPAYYEKIIDKTNGGRIKISPLF